MFSLFRQIIENSPTIKVLDMQRFDKDDSKDQNKGELILETLLISNINTIIDLNLCNNKNWFKQPIKKDERCSNIELLADLISKQSDLQHLNLNENNLSSDATLTILTRIANLGTSSKLQTLNLSHASFEADETVGKLSDILSSACRFKKCNISKQIGRRQVEVVIKDSSDKCKRVIEFVDIRAK